ncbi:MAG: helix-turn-helix domain-containing protein [Pseudomonadota bacterium]
MDPDLYKILDPPKSLKPFVRRILYTDCNDEVAINLPAPPTGYNYIQWIARGHGEAVGSLTPAVIEGPTFGIAGQIENIDAHVNLAGRLRHIVAELSAQGLYSLLGIFGQDVASRTVFFEPGDTHYTDSVKRLVEFGCSDPPIRAVLDAFFQYLQHLSSNCFEAPAYIEEGAQRAERALGNIRLSDMAGEIGERHFSRQFRRYVGIRPVYFANVIRVNGVLPRLVGAQPGDLARIAQEAGFYDQSHLIKAIKSHCKTTPKGFADRVDTILARFHMDGRSEQI